MNIIPPNNPKSLPAACGRNPLAVTAALLMSAAGFVSSEAQGVEFNARVLVDTPCEFSGEWYGRVGYFDSETGVDEGGTITLTGVMSGANFFLDYEDPFFGISAEVSRGMEGANTLVDWTGLGAGAFSNVVDGYEYRIVSEYSRGGTTDAESEPEDGWGYVDGTFSIRRLECPSTVPENGSGFLLFGLTMCLVISGHRGSRSAGHRQ